MSKRVVAFILSAGLFLPACSSTSSPVSPSTPTASAAIVSGTWAGTTTDSTGSTSAVWTVTQTATTVTGKMSMSDDVRSMMGNGAMSGTMNGKALTFHMAVPTGGFTGMMAMCSVVMDGQGMMSDDGHTMTGTYSGSFSGMMSNMMGSQQSCGGVMSSGTFSMTR